MLKWRQKRNLEAFGIRKLSSKLSIDRKDKLAEWNKVMFAQTQSKLITSFMTERSRSAGSRFIVVIVDLAESAQKLFCVNLIGTENFSN